MENIKNKLFDNLYSQGEFWVNYKNQNNFIPYKIHVYADNESDLRFILNETLPILIGYGINHKFIAPSNLSKLNYSIQKGKAITIYPPNIKMLKFLLLTLDLKLLALELRFKKIKQAETNIIGDKPYGNSGRLFYRYELDSGEYKNMIFDPLNAELMSFYHKHYQPNRGGNKYLADDMTEKDDPLLSENEDKSN